MSLSRLLIKIFMKIVMIGFIVAGILVSLWFIKDDYYGYVAEENWDPVMVSDYTKETYYDYVIGSSEAKQRYRFIVNYEHNGVDYEEVKLRVDHSDYISDAETVILYVNPENPSEISLGRDPESSIAGGVILISFVLPCVGIFFRPKKRKTMSNIKRRRSV